MDTDREPHAIARKKRRRGRPVDARLDARGSERSLQIALADPAEGSDDVAYYFHDGALVERRRHGRGEASRARFEAAEQCSHRALHCTPNVATVMSCAWSRRCGEYLGSPVRVLRDLRVPEHPQRQRSVLA